MKKSLPLNLHAPQQGGIQAPADFSYQDVDSGVLLIVPEFCHYSAGQFIFRSFMAGKY